MILKIWLNKAKVVWYKASVESGEGIERILRGGITRRSLICTWNPVKELKVIARLNDLRDDFNFVESGEGIESPTLIGLRRAEGPIVWNPVKELKVPSVLNLALKTSSVESGEGIESAFRCLVP